MLDLKRPERIADKGLNLCALEVCLADRVSWVELSDGKAVDVWVVDLDDRSIPRATVDSLLSADELERAARFVFEPDAWHFKLCRAILRVGLALHLQTPLQKIQLRTAERGKPFLDHCALHFSVSRCKGIGLVAFSLCGEIGVDVEEVRMDVAALEIAAQNFHPREFEYIALAQHAKEQALRFTRVWTRKEAVLKATGDGISDDMKNFDVSGQSRIALDSKSEPRYAHLLVQDMTVSESMIGALAGPENGWTMMQSRQALGSLMIDLGLRI